LINEIFADAIRNDRSVIVTQIDRANAFGSVSHSQLWAVMEQMGLPKAFIEMVKEIYRGTTSIIELPSGDTDALDWTHGVNQGCSLSPLLFDLCIEPFLRHLDAIKHEVGYIKNDIVYCVLAYADDLAFVSDTVEKQQRIPRIFEDYCEHTKLKVNVEKCVTVFRFLIEKSAAGDIRFGYPSHCAARTFPSTSIPTQ
jgi:hypothetical protein